MKNFLRYGFTAIALTFVLSAFAATPANAQGIVTEVLKRMDAHYKLLKSLQADVSRETFNSQLGETDKASGTISLLPGKGRNFSLRLDWEKPKAENIAVVNGQYVAYNPGIGQAWIGSSGSKTLSSKGGNALQVMSMSREEIKANYNVEYLGQEGISGAVQTWHLKLTPKVKSNYKFVDLWVDGNGMPLQGKITLLNNDTDTILLTRLKKNETIAGSTFKINLPKGTKIVKG